MASDLRYTVRMPAGLAEQLGNLAELHGRSLNREIIRAAEVWAAQLQSPAVREALANAERVLKSVQGQRESLESVENQLERSEVREAIQTLAQPEVQEALKRLQALIESSLGASASSFARDWGSDADRAYDTLQ